MLVQATTPKTKEDVERIVSNYMLHNEKVYNGTMRAIYFPAILASAAQDYVDAALQCCAKLKLPLKTTTRTIKELQQVYKNDVFRSMSAQGYERLFNIRELFFDRTDSSFGALWNIYTKILSQRHPEYSPMQLDLYRNAHIALLLLRVVVRYQKEAEIQYQEYYAVRKDMVDHSLESMIMQIQMIVKQCDIYPTPALKRSMRAIINQMDKVIMKQNFTRNGRN